MQHQFEYEETHWLGRAYGEDIDDRIYKEFISLPTELSNPRLGNRDIENCRRCSLDMDSYSG